MICFSQLFLTISKTKPTYPDFYSGKMKNLHRWRFFGRISVELPPALVPFNRVQAVILDVIEAFEHRFLPAPHRVRHPHPHITQRCGQFCKKKELQNSN